MGTHSGQVYDPEPPREQRRYFTQSIRAAKAGVSFGPALAIAISGSEHHSILWAIVQGFFSWSYVIYYALTHNCTRGRSRKRARTPLRPRPGPRSVTPRERFDGHLAR